MRTALIVAITFTFTLAHMRKQAAHSAQPGGKMRVETQARMRGAFRE